MNIATMVLVLGVFKASLADKKPKTHSNTHKADPTDIALQEYSPFVRMPSFGKQDQFFILILFQSHP